jgi:hypothetical protein
MRQTADILAFDANLFLTKEFGLAQNVLVMFSRYGIESPKLETVEKWYRRRSIPGPWLPRLISLLELDQSAPVSLAPYTRLGRG